MTLKQRKAHVLVQSACFRIQPFTLMVFCVKHFLPLILLPYPSAAPLFTLAYIVSFFLTVQPCVYCTILVSVLFTSTCYTHLSNPVEPTSTPTISIQPPSNNTSFVVFPLSPVQSLNMTQTVTRPIYTFDAPDPNRSWADFNGGHFSDPVLVGYKYRGKLLAAAEEAEELEAQRQKEAREIASREAATRAEEARATLERSLSWGQRVRRDLVQSVVRVLGRLSVSFGGPSSVPKVQQLKRTPSVLPKDALCRDPLVPRWDSSRKRFDARFNGVGVILDFGWGRGERDVEESFEWERERRKSEKLRAKEKNV